MHTNHVDGWRKKSMAQPPQHSGRLGVLVRGKKKSEIIVPVLEYFGNGRYFREENGKEGLYFGP